MVVAGAVGGAAAGAAAGVPVRRGWRIGRWLAAAGAYAASVASKRVVDGGNCAFGVVGRAVGSQARRAVVLLVGRRVNLQHRSVNRCPDKQTATARVGKDLGLQSHVGRRRGLPANGARGCRRIHTHREFAAQQIVDAVARIEHQNHVGRLNAHLPTHAAASHRHECRRPPDTVIIANHGDALAVTHARHEPDLDHARHDDQPLRVGKHRTRNPLVGHGHELVQHVRGRLDDRRLLRLSRRHLPPIEMQTDNRPLPRPNNRFALTTSELLFHEVECSVQDGDSSENPAFWGNRVFAGGKAEGWSEERCHCSSHACSNAEDGHVSRAVPKSKKPLEQCDSAHAQIRRA